MSKYIPWAAVAREYNQQLLRIQHGLKTGFYVKYPDPDKGPHIIKKSRLDILTPEQLASLGGPKL